MKKENLYNTKWDARLWTIDQKTQWLNVMFELGFDWIYAPNYNSDFYYVYTNGISWLNDEEHFHNHKNTQFYKLEGFLPKEQVDVKKPSYEELKGLTLEVMSVFDINDYDDTEHLAEDAVTLAEDIYKLLKDKTEG